MSEIDALLGNFGLSKYEKHVIRDLYINGASTADDIAKRFDMRPSRVYEALDSLSSKHFVEISNSRPRVYNAKHPQEAITQYIQRAKSDFSDRITQLNNDGATLLELVEPLYLKSHFDILPGELISQFSNLTDAEEFTKNLINSAKEEILIFSHIFSWYDIVRDDIRNAINRGCEVKILMQTNSEIDDKLAEMIEMGIKVKSIPPRSIMSRGTIVDRTSMIFIIWASEENDSGKTRRIYKPQYSTNSGIVDVFCGNFNFLWERN
ncbi:MAG: hypothetical protein HeimC2_27090 [Candidatus Heimdallarchaeota archaeon LC_2]|nr:MAG: hypothetical protein HeimC2_27090 [Candidatus Heimdallarchaeota archaeon LC_2]